MWKYIINIIFYPITWLWNNVMNVSIYGVRPVQIFAMLAFGMALYRFVIIPFSTQFSVSPELPAKIGRMSREFSKDMNYKNNNISDRGY